MTKLAIREPPSSNDSTVASQPLYKRHAAHCTLIMPSLTLCALSNQRSNALPNATYDIQKPHDQAVLITQRRRYQSPQARRHACTTTHDGCRQHAARQQPCCAWSALVRGRWPSRPGAAVSPPPA
jgi:hypothetical protein